MRYDNNLSLLRQNVAPRASSDLEKKQKEMLKSRQVLKNIGPAVDAKRPEIHEIDRQNLFSFINGVHSAVCQMCASNTKRYMKIVQRIFYNFIQKYVNIFKTIEPQVFLKIIGDDAVRSNFADILLCTVIAGMRLAQPMELTNLGDIELYEENI